MDEEKKKLLLCLYFGHISPGVYSNFDRESSLNAELNSTCNEYPLSILLTGPATLKTRNTWKNVMIIITFFQVFLVFGVAGCVKSMLSGYLLDVELIMHPTSSPDRNLSKNTRRYVENSNKKSSFFNDTYPQIYIKKYLRPIWYFKFKEISLPSTWWNGIWFKVKRPILSWNFLYI